MRMNMTFIITTDVDFVSDDLLRIAYEPLKHIPITIFMTGPSDYLKNTAKRNPLWEIEPHPNFCEASTHGSCINEVLSTISTFPCENIGFRCHRYYSSNDVEERFFELGFGYASNICTDLECIKPFFDRCGLLQIPIFFEDGGYLKAHGVPSVCDILPHINEKGVYVFNFHPIHLALNSCSFDKIHKIKRSMPPSSYSSLSQKDIDALKNNGYGVFDFLSELLSYAKENNIQFLNLKQYYEQQKANRI